MSVFGAHPEGTCPHASRLGYAVAWGMNLRARHLQTRGRNHIFPQDIRQHVPDKKYS